MIGDVFREDIDKALERGKETDMEEGEVARVLCWSEEELPIPKKVDCFTFLEEGEKK